MKTTPTLFYREAWNGSLVFAPPAEAQRLHAINTAIQTAKTWGEFRQLMPKDDYDEIVERVSEYWDSDESDGPMPPEETAFDSDRLPGYNDGDYPDWLQQRADRFLPEDVLKQFGDELSTTLNGNYWHIDPAHEAAIVAMLTESGIHVVKREDLEFS